MSTRVEVAALCRPQYPPDVVISLLAAASLHHITAAAKIFSFILVPLFNVLALVVLLAPQLGCGLPPLSLFENLGAIILLIYHLALLSIICGGADILRAGISGANGWIYPSSPLRGNSLGPMQYGFLMEQMKPGPELTASSPADTGLPGGSTKLRKNVAPRRSSLFFAQLVEGILMVDSGRHDVAHSARRAYVRAVDVAPAPMQLDDRSTVKLRPETSPTATYAHSGSGIHGARVLLSARMGMQRSFPCVDDSWPRQQRCESGAD
ncbi:hypothetical protein B0H14DRAFT_2647937 [Mycena olivaceomarginata]|nr:hypothetical protein B0H14DRAFT_2647937 [Mycena olivaceomarginata]